MASKKVSELTELTSFSDGAYIPVVKDGVTYKMSLQNVLQKTFRSDESSEMEIFSDEALVPVFDGETTLMMTVESLLQKTLRTDKTYDVAEIAAKTTISNNDLILLEDSDDSNTKKQCSKTQFLYDVPQVLIGSGIPSDTPTKKGMIYVDTTASDAYIAVDTTASGDWKLIT